GGRRDGDGPQGESDGDRAAQGGGRRRHRSRLRRAVDAEPRSAARLEGATSRKRRPDDRGRPLRDGGGAEGIARALAGAAAAAKEPGAENPKAADKPEHAPARRDKPGPAAAKKANTAHAAAKKPAAAKKAAARKPAPKTPARNPAAKRPVAKAKAKAKR